MPASYYEPLEGSERPAIINQIRDEIRRGTKRLRKHGLDPTVYADPSRSQLLLIKTGDEWMRQQRNKPAPRRLFGDFWFEHELCIMFADTNLGKSVLAVQIGSSLALHTAVGPFANELTQPARVLYVDFELTAKQFEQRYQHPVAGSRHFGHTFYRAELNPRADNPAFYDDRNAYILSALEGAITRTNAGVLIIDNLTCIRSSTERAADALPLMQQLKALKTTYKLSILALAHTPKRNTAKPITVNDLQGSKMLINFADSAFAIGQSQRDPSKRYLKQIKQRSAQQQYGEQNVCTGHLVKELNNLKYMFDGHSTEDEHLQKRTRALQQQQAQELHRQGHGYRHISRVLGISTGTVSKLLAGHTG
ncbi:LuxR family transcriptional regulator [Mucilaginibacter terrenus]|uniref:LuxR family transcriptional regulator n=1 Tax=Mucilaginibacter terrenus TaxID=2482727 RepID=A0A3E2NJW0_9SPHI|nr:AAA family ATPase [Mucilaginibacter terrenus]RFZ81279.1 LuxR family transcriptional regulator [Mucilaginibacter terrenus]